MAAKEKNIRIRLSICSKGCVIDGGYDLIKQVYINLINNALKFTHEGGRISVTLKKTGGMIVVSVKDNGKGISKEYIPKLFNKFVQVDSSMVREQGGTGLGLVIVKHILDLHDGTIEVDSVEGKGSTFTFTLPVKHVPEKKDNEEQLKGNSQK